MIERKDFKEFCDAVSDGISDYLLNYNVEKIKLETVKHNNGVCHTGLVIVLCGESFAPSIYLESFYEQYMAGKTLDDILPVIAKQYHQIRNNLEEQEKFSVDIGAMEQCVFLRLVNYERNREILEDCPYIPFHDMAITFRYLVRKDEKGVASALIHNAIMEHSGLTLEQMYCAARENTMRMFPPFVERLDCFLRERFPNEEGYPEQPNVFVLSNQQFIYGATMILYKDILADFAEKTASDFYIIPSSVNEVLLYLADETADRRMLETTLREVNAYMVSKMDFLSDEIYFYDKKLGRIITETLDE